MALISKGGTCRDTTSAWTGLDSVIVIEYLRGSNCFFGHRVEVNLISSDLQDCH